MEIKSAASSVMSPVTEDIVIDCAPAISTDELADSKFSWEAALMLMPPAELVMPTLPVASISILAPAEKIVLPAAPKTTPSVAEMMFTLASP